jgi:hypothetical protein
MRVKELIAHLKKMPQEAECIYAIDHDGNSYKQVFYKPSFYDETHVHPGLTSIKAKATVCIN